MAIAFDASTPAIGTAAAAGFTSGSFTPPTGSLLVVCTLSGGSGRTVTVSSSNSLTFTQRALKNNLSGACSVAIYTAVMGSSTSITVTTTWSAGTSNVTKIWVLTGALGSAPVGQSFTGPGSNVTSLTWSPSLYTSSSDVSMMISIAGSVQASAPAPVMTSTDTFTSASPNAQVTAISTHKASTTTPNGTSVSGNYTSDIAPSTSWAGVAVEIIPDTQPVSPTGIGSGEAFGTAALTQIIAPSGIASQEAFGTTNLTLFVLPSGIASAEAFGTASAFVLLLPTGIPSAEAVGTPALIYNQSVSPTGIASAQAFGIASLQVGYPQSLQMIAILSAEAFGIPTIGNLSVWVLAPDHIQETPAGRNILHYRYGIDRGISLVKKSGVWSEVRYPAQTELEEAQKYYLGGHRHYLTPEEATDLISQGFGDLLHLELIPNYQGVSG